MVRRNPLHIVESASLSTAHTLFDNSDGLGFLTALDRRGNPDNCLMERLLHLDPTVRATVSRLQEHRSPSRTTEVAFPPRLNDDAPKHPTKKSDGSSSGLRSQSSLTSI